MLSLWLLYSGVFVGYLLGRRDSFTSNNVAVAAAAVGSLTGFWMTVLAIPEVIELAKRGRIDHDAVGGVVAAAAFLAGILAGFAWGRFAKSAAVRDK